MKTSRFGADFVRLRNSRLQVVKKKKVRLWDHSSKLEQGTNPALLISLGCRVPVW